MLDIEVSEFVYWRLYVANILPFWYLGPNKPGRVIISLDEEIVSALDTHEGDTYDLKVNNMLNCLSQDWN